MQTRGAIHSALGSTHLPTWPWNVAPSHIYPQALRATCLLRVAQSAPCTVLCELEHPPHHQRRRTPYQASRLELHARCLLGCLGRGLVALLDTRPRAHYAKRHVPCGCLRLLHQVTTSWSLSGDVIMNGSRIGRIWYRHFCPVTQNDSRTKDKTGKANSVT